MTATLEKPVAEKAGDYTRAGLSVLPIRADGSKAPAVTTWKQFQSRIAGADELRGMFGNNGTMGVAIVAGKVSGNLEIIDFDKAGLFEQFAQRVEQQQPGLIERTPRVRTPRMGTHVFYRCERIEGNQKLAQEPTTDEATGKVKPLTLIETRGEGGYVVAEGSPAKCHPTGNLYRHVAGPALTDIPTISVAERDVLLRVARSFNLWVDETPADMPNGETAKRHKAPDDRLSPGDDYNARTTFDEILTAHGWTQAGISGDKMLWRRPGKKPPGISGDTYISNGKGGELFSCFTDNAHPLTGARDGKPCTTYSKFALYAAFNHGSDFSAAAKALAAQGYGEKSKGHFDTLKNQSGQNAQNDTTAKPGIANFELIETTDADGKPKKSQRPMPMQELIASVNRATDKWPRRCGPSLFVHDSGGVAWLDSANAMFGWLGTAAGNVRWSMAMGCVAKGELFAELRRMARDYRAVELHPREPALQNVYCTYPTPEPGDGKVLRELLDCFCPATPIDRDLIQAAFMTAMWGGDGGSRPAFVFTSDEGRGKGKSTVAEMIGRLFGGTIDFSTKDDIGEIKSRLLSSEALVKRLALLDNIKSLRFSWAELEGLITSEEINGKRMYVGDASRPNTLTWFLTLNGASLSTDMAQRAVVVKVTNPKRSATWEEDTKRLISEHRAELIADLIGCLRAPQYKLAEYTRWASWERGVLSRLPEPAEAQRVILERQGDCDAEAEDNSIIEDHFGQQLERLGYATDQVEVFIPSDVAARWLNWATNDKQKTGPASRMLKQMIGERSITRLRHNKCKTWGRGFVWEGENVDVESTVHTDLKQRIAKQKEKNES